MFNTHIKKTAMEITKKTVKAALNKKVKSLPSNQKIIFRLILITDPATKEDILKHEMGIDSAKSALASLKRRGLVRSKQVGDDVVLKVVDLEGFEIVHFGSRVLLDAEHNKGKRKELKELESELIDIQNRIFSIKKELGKI
jgi:hypothetical protein